MGIIIDLTQLHEIPIGITRVETHCLKCPLDPFCGSTGIAREQAKVGDHVRIVRIEVYCPLKLGNGAVVLTKTVEIVGSQRPMYPSNFRARFGIAWVEISCLLE